MTIYRRGQRVVLVSTADPHIDLRAGATGTVRSHDTTGNVVDVDWDSGCTLAMLLDDGDRIALADTLPAGQQDNDAIDCAHADPGCGPPTDDGSIAYVDELPSCDIHRHAHNTEIPARYDAALRQGSWAYVCDTCFTAYGLGLGTGRGQRLIVGRSPGRAEPAAGN